MGGNAYGALPPPGREWMMGRTVEEIDSVAKEAQETGKTEAEVAAARWPKTEPATTG